MKLVLKILRAIVVTLLLLITVVPALLYVILSVPAFQKWAGERTERELTSLLGSPVEIGEVTISPFNRVALKNVTVVDSAGIETLKVGHLGAGINLIDLIFRGKVIISYAEFIDLNLNLYRDSLSAPINIQPIIDRFKPKDPNKPPTPFDLAVNMVVIRRSSIDYNVLSEPAGEAGRFDPAHIAVSDLRADIKLPRLRNNDFIMEVKRLAAGEKSGLMLKELKGNFVLSDTAASVTGLTVDLPASHVAVADIGTSYHSLKTIGKDIVGSPLSLLVLPGSYVTPSDLSAFVPALANADFRTDIEIDLLGTADNISINRLDISAAGSDLWIRGSGSIAGLVRHDNLYAGINRLSISAPGEDIASIVSYFTPLKPDVAELLGRAGNVNLLGDLTFSRRELGFNGAIDCDAGNVDVDVMAALPSQNAPLQLQGTVSTEQFSPAVLIPSLSGKFGQVGLNSDFDLSLGKRNDIRGDIRLGIDHAEWNGYAFKSIEGNADFHNHMAEVEVECSDPELDFSLQGQVSLDKSNQHLEFFADVKNVALDRFTAAKKFSGYSLSLEADTRIDGYDPDKASGWLTLNDVRLTGDERSVYIDSIAVDARVSNSTRIIELQSALIDGRVRGRFPVKRLVPTAKEIIAEVYPALMSGLPAKKMPRVYTDENGREMPDIDFDFNFTLKPDTVVAPFFNLPLSVIDNITIAGAMDSRSSLMSFSIDAPYLLQKSKLIENTSLRIGIDGIHNRSSIYATSVMPTKNGPMTLIMQSTGRSDDTDTDLSWHIKRERGFHGNINFSTSFSRDSLDGNMLLTRVNINPSTLVFNDTVWTVHPSVINARKNFVNVAGFSVGREGQFVEIDGRASADTTDVINLRLRDIDLDYVFGTLNISNVMFGGQATGEFFASSLFSKSPVLYTPSLKVDGISYNGCVMGDAVIESSWDNSSKSVLIDAEIDSGDNHVSYIDGSINPGAEELDFRFKADRAPAGFMRPFMEAFADDVEGFVSGDAHLYGTFHDINMTGDIFAQDLKLKLGFTNTTYSATDSVHILPGRIEFSDVVLTDMYGKSAKLSGYLTHKCFHEPRFRFNISDARDFLVYDVKENDEHPWYGRIFGNGRASVTGYPGVVNIDVTMETAPPSSFTFILTDAESAEDYDFITFRDRDRQKKDSIARLDPTPLLVRQVRDNIRREEDGPPTVYSMDFDVSVTPRATMNLIMDPVAGDRIRATGSGDMKMHYSSDGELDMRGKYTVDEGDYNFTLQDIIIKEFKLDRGSSITFSGDPYAAELDITAIYPVNANLSDLDESFLQDKELNRTNVKVNSILHASGDMRHPDISFDLDFPTLTQDIKRKVRSIVSTEDMMNRQIIYLLALGRFYTPDYMTATRGNELVSVASSTISSQLSSMLGQLSDKFSIAPQFRSDRGDFSDVEVDVALSSHLLNNRLLLNGNFGYRDKSLNNNSFIGDFDIEYLLNRPGTIRLKAYNRYNDQNYYLKSALTTQGVGVVFKRDFDNVFGFLRSLRRKKKTSADTVPEALPDTLLIPSDTTVVVGTEDK
mgnify:FL=1